MTKYEIGGNVLDTVPESVSVRATDMAPEDQSISSSGPYFDQPKDANERAPVTYALAPLTNRNDLATLWQQLEQQFEPSLFQSWGWIECWLGVLPDDIEPLVLTARRFEHLCGIALIFRENRRRHGWLKSKGLFLNETGVPRLDALTIEYNGFLCDKDEASDLTVGALNYLKSDLSGWDEFTFSGIDVPTYAAFQKSENLVNINARLPCHYVDLSTIRAKGSTYLDCLSRNTRSQIRRAMRRYEERGDIEVSAAGTVEQALDYFEEMRVLHQKYWTGRGHPGAFANPIFGQFHGNFIKSQFSAGQIEMLRITVDGAPIGCLYNILHRGRVYNYQSGFDYEADGAMKPGLVAHYLAIERSLENGASIYDFMAGDAQQKRSLGIASQELIWITVSLPRFKYHLENRLRALKQKWGAARAK